MQCNRYVDVGDAIATGTKMELFIWKGVGRVLNYITISSFIRLVWEKERLCTKNWQSSCLFIVLDSIWLQTTIKLGKVRSNPKKDLKIDLQQHWSLCEN